MNLIKEMILNGLSCNFHGEDLGIPDEAHAELDFDIEQNGYHIRGFIDQLFLYKDKKIAIIRDYKTSKKMFEGFPSQSARCFPQHSEPASRLMKRCLVLPRAQHFLRPLKSALLLGSISFSLCLMIPLTL